MLVCLERRLDRLVMRKIRSGNADGINLRLGQQLVIVGDSRLNPILLTNLIEPFLSPIANSGHGSRRMRGVNADILFSHDAEADYSDAYFICHLHSRGAKWTQVIC